MSAKTTASGSEPPAYVAPNGMDAAIAAPGAMSVMLWNRTSRSPIASLRSVGAGTAVMAPPRDQLIVSRPDIAHPRLGRGLPGQTGGGRGARGAPPGNTLDPPGA